MKLSISFHTIVASMLCAIPMVVATVTFNVSPDRANCGRGTTITCTNPSSSAPCKGNFNPKQNVIHVTGFQSGCHISLYPANNQAGGVMQRVDAGTPASVCATPAPTTTAAFQSYGVYCS
ncbi:hypothetical protein CPB83DRAFT_498649 [Crepidotus variabilis]|uniref:Secreted protein n=1 Tax=Crepidotus variabilis TaxID=179855 RepID=A0A9P6JMY4_9AGAR|nr:hypothetical protein CPB83DRAFT_498649 [Crepidotus variabilis]